MRGTLTLATLFLLASGCAAPLQQAPAANPSTLTEAEAARGYAVPSEHGATSPSLAATASADLLVSVAEMRVPAGRWGVTRLVLTPEAWGEELPWDGEAEVRYGFLLSSAQPTHATVMDGLQFRPAFKDETPSPAHAYFLSVALEGKAQVGGGMIMTSAGGDGVSLPAHELAWLVGSPDQELVFRFGLLPRDGEFSVEAITAALSGRPAVEVAPDAIGTSFLSGTHVAIADAEGKFSDYTSGAVTYEETAAASQGPLSVSRASRLAGDGEATAPGMASLLFANQDLAGAEQWSYAFEAEGRSDSFTGAWVEHAPVVVPGAVPAFGIVTGPVAPGPLSFEVERDFSGASLTPMVLASYRLATWGYASVDLGALYGWNVEARAYPEGGLPTGTSWTSCMAPVPCLQHL